MVDKKGSDMRSIVVLASMSLALLGGCGTNAPNERTAAPPPPPPYKPVASVLQLMESVNDPAADVIWESSGTIITKDKVEERGPKNDEEWAVVRSNAIMLTEAGNLLMMPPRARDQDAWMKAALGLVEAGQATLKAAEAKNVEQIFTTGGELYQKCLECHSKYLPGGQWVQ
jgi:hypothetical protein